MTDNQGTIISGTGGDLLDVLLAQGVLNDEQFDQARRRMRRAQIPAQQAVLDLGISTQEVVYRALSQVTGIPFVILGEITID